MIYVLYGQPASGKTTLGNLLADELNTPFVIDGDEFREMFTNKNYGRQGREENIKNANAVATYLNKKGEREDWLAIYCRKEDGVTGRPVKEGSDVVMCLVNPYEHLRKELKNNNQDRVVEIFLQSSRDLRKSYHVEDFEKGEPDYFLLTDSRVEETWGNLKNLLEL
jgi:adenylylsulfate kinase-like enzyme|tara:strand:+ start:6128 stop:6625 length:498 start_codon:yes stop_codon:yes gene_type:complete